MKQRARLLTVGTTALAGALASVAWSGPALAEKPAHAGPPDVMRSPLTQDAPTFLCGDRVIKVTGGEFFDRSRELPGGRFLSQTLGRQGTGVDQHGNTYKIRVSGTFRGSETEFDGRLRSVLIGPGGAVYRVDFDFTTEGRTVTGDCTVSELP
jgi:hypothetical protein